MRSWRSFHFPLAKVNSRRIQISAVFHSVRTTAPGVPLVPKPPGPCFHEEASKSVLNQAPVCVWVVNCHWIGSFSEVGTTMTTFGAFGNGAQLAALARSLPAHFFQVGRS